MGLSCHRRPLCFQKLAKPPDLILAVPAQRDWSQRPYCDRSPSEARRQGQDVPLDFGGEVIELEEFRKLTGMDADHPGQRCAR